MGKKGISPARRWLGHRGFWLFAGFVMLAAVACGVAATSTSPPRSTAPPSSTASPAAGLAVPTEAGSAAAIPASPTPAPTPVATDGGEGKPLPTPTTTLNASTPIPKAPDTGEGVPKVDKSIHNVPLEDIIFDTFGAPGGNVSLDIASEPLILGLRDAIVPIDEPVYGLPDSLPWLDDDDLVLGYDSGDEAYAYPVNVLDRHELVNDVIEGVAVLISYCPLCFSGVVYNRELEGRVLTFGNTSALYQSDLVMYDHQTGSYWFQVGGEAVVGPLTDTRLKLLPSTTMLWGEWRELYPETRLLTGIAGNPSLFARNQYRGDFPKSYAARIDNDAFVFPVHREFLDSRLSSGELVLTVEVAGAVTAFPLDRIGDSAVNHNVGGRPVVVFARAESRAVGAFLPVVEGRSLTFDYLDQDQTFVDQETGSVWDAAGRAIAGPLIGAEMERLNTRRAFWFSIAIAFPDIDVYLP